MAHEWVAEAGEFEVLVGSSSQDIRSTASFMLTTTSRSGGLPAQKQVKLDLDSMLSQLVANDEARAILNAHLPGMLDTPEASMAMGLTLSQIAVFVPDILTSEVLRRIGSDLEQLGQ